MARTVLLDLASIIHAVNDIGFHDLPVDAMRFGMDQASVTLEVRDFDDEADVYRSIIITFNGVSDLSLQDHGLMKVDEVTDIQVAAAGEGFKAVILFLCGVSGPSLEMGFAFTSVTMEGWPYAGQE